MASDQALILLRRCAAVLRPLRWISGAVAAGVVAGWLATTLMVPDAPPLPLAAVSDEVPGLLLPAATASIEVTALAPPDMPLPPLVVSGPAHVPAELAPLYFRFPEADNPAPRAARTLPGPPHLGAEAALLAALQAPAPSTRPLPGAPHRPGELYLLLTRAPGPEAPATVAASRPGPPHTMPEVVLLYGALERERAAGPKAVAVVATGWIEADNDNPAPAGLPLPEQAPQAQDMPEAGGEVAISETGPEFEPGAAVPVMPDPGTVPMIAIMIDDLGLNATRTRHVTELPAPLTMAFIPYGENLDQQTRLAAAAGHEIFLHLPMEPTDPTVDPGPHALLERLDPSALADELAWNLDRFTGYVGVNNHMGSLLTQNRRAMALVMAELHGRGLVFVDSMTSAGSVAYETALAAGVPAARRDVFLDNVPESAAVLAQIARLEEVARRQGFAIGIGHPHDATVAALAVWLPQARARGFSVVPVSRIIASRALLLAQHADE